MKKETAGGERDIYRDRRDNERDREGERERKRDREGEKERRRKSEREGHTIKEENWQK